MPNSKTGYSSCTHELEDAVERMRAEVRILLVEDNQDTALEQQGHDVMAARDGPSAREIAVAFRPSAVLLDLGLPVWTAMRWRGGSVKRKG
jgi:CheY-like chemotaxis protein